MKRIGGAILVLVGLALVIWSYFPARDQDREDILAKARAAKAAKRGMGNGKSEGEDIEGATE